MFPCDGTARERKAWLISVTHEENQRLKALRAAVKALESEKTPDLNQINQVLVTAFQGEITLMRASRVFHARSTGKRINLTQAMVHLPTVALAQTLHQFWRSVGVSESTLEILLRHVVHSIGAATRSTRASLVLGVDADVRWGKLDPHALEAFVAEGSGEARVDVPAAHDFYILAW